jgi:hypothetical protein
MQLSAADSVKFSIVVGLSAIFVDAVIAHGLFWENDPYWTYWITKSFLITSVFLAGTGFIGIGLWQGAALTAVHTLILEIYYQWLTPVGLPQEPEWLDFNHLWTTGVPAHYLAILGGYFLALWLWRRRYRAPVAGEQPPFADASAFVLYSLAAAVLVTVFDGVITQLILLRDFPGITFFVQHILIAFVFVAAWTIATGVGWQGWLVGSLMLALVWGAYNMYLGPRGLPLSAPRYIGYYDLWLYAVPGAFVSSILGWWLAGQFINRFRLLRAATTSTTIIVFALLTGMPCAEAAEDKSAIQRNGLEARAKASGQAVRVVGPDPVDMKSTRPVTGEITVRTVEMGNRWSHVQNTDLVEAVATFGGPDGNYTVTINKPMPRHPLGQYTTWSGVVYDHEMHGDTGIGTSKLARMKPDIALWGWAEVKRNNEVIVPMAPAHVMVTTKGAHTGVMLEVNAEDKALRGEPDGYITVMWPKVDSLAMPHAQTTTRKVIGWIALIGFVVLFGGLAFAEGAGPRR